jgi:hypothetical protein
VVAIVSPYSTRLKTFPAIVIARFSGLIVAGQLFQQIPHPVHLSRST